MVEPTLANRLKAERQTLGLGPPTNLQAELKKTTPSIRNIFAYVFTILGLCLFVGWHVAYEGWEIWTEVIPELFPHPQALDTTDRILYSGFFAMTATIIPAPFVIHWLAKSRILQGFMGGIPLVAGLLFGGYIIYDQYGDTELIILTLAPISTSLGVILVKPIPRSAPMH